MSHEAVETDRQLTISTLEDGAAWDAFVLAHEDGTFCHLAGWRDILADVLAREPRYLVARDTTDAIRGVLPMAIHRSRVFGDRMVSLPFLNYGGPIGAPDAVAALVRDALSRAEQRGASLELRSRTPIESPVPLVSRKVTVLLPLPDDPEVLWTSFKSKVRSQVRRPRKAGMTHRIGPDQMEPFYQVFAHNMRDLGTPVLPRRLFEELLATFPETVVFSAVYHEGRPVAAGAGFVHGDEFEITWASSLRQFNRQAPNMLLYWSLMEEMIRRGLAIFNFGRCTPGEGTHRFKLQWGGHDHPLPWLQWPEPDEEAGTPGRAVRLASSVWQRLPVSMANRMGPVAARMLPWW